MKKRENRLIRNHEKHVQALFSNDYVKREKKDIDDSNNSHAAITPFHFFLFFIIIFTVSFVFNINDINYLIYQPGNLHTAQS